MRRILLVDADAFFVAVARSVDPEGAGRAPLLIVGGSADGRGVVCSASYEARAFGVRSAMSTARALRLCPNAMVVPVPRGACGTKSREIRRVLERYAPKVQAASIDEWYLDLAGTERLYHDEPLAETARRIRSAALEETGLSVSIGGGTTKLLAKLAAEAAKPRPNSRGADGVLVVDAGTEAEFLRGVALADIPGIGPRTQQQLERYGLRTVDDVLAADHDALVRHLGERGAEWLLNRVRGGDDAHIDTRGDSRSISHEHTFPRDLADNAELERELLGLATRVAADMRADGYAARTVTVRIKDADFKRRQAGRTLPEAVESDRVIYSVARELLHRLRARRKVPARLLGVALSQLASHPGPLQPSLFGADASTNSVETERDRTVSHTVDKVRAKLGRDLLTVGRVRD